MEPKLISERDACKYLNCSRSFLAGSRMGDLPGRTPGPPWIRLGRGVRYSVRDLDEWIEKHRQNPRAFPREEAV
jgi:predicted DNA-binding transcriptional regulator AlpA